MPPPITSRNSYHATSNHVKELVEVRAPPITSRNSLRSFAVTCNADLKTSYRKNWPAMIAPDHKHLLGTATRG